MWNWVLGLIKPPLCSVCCNPHWRGERHIWNGNSPVSAKGEGVVSLMRPRGRQKSGTKVEVARAELKAVKRKTGVATEAHELERVFGDGRREPVSGEQVWKEFQAAKMRDYRAKKSKEG